MSEQQPGPLFPGDYLPRLADGRILPANIVLIGVGVSPATELPEPASLEIDNGIVVDEFTRSSDRDIVAAGDCTNQYYPNYDKRLCLKSVQNSNDQAKISAKTPYSKLEPHDALPWLWSGQYDLKLRTPGSCKARQNDSVWGCLQRSQLRRLIFCW